MKNAILVVIALTLMVAAHNIPAQGYGSEPLSLDTPAIDYGYGYDVYDYGMPQDSYITPHVGSGGYTETYPGRGSITVNPDGFGGYSIHRNGFIPRNRW